MQIYNGEDMVMDTYIELSCVDQENIIDDGEYIMIPYTNKEFLVAIKPLIDEVVVTMQPTWREPDYENSRCYFYISGDNINLSVEALPRRYSAIEKQNMIEFANNEELENGWSEDLALMNMFDDIDEILNCNNPIGEVKVYRLELTSIEQNTLYSVLKIK